MVCVRSKRKRKKTRTKWAKPRFPKMDDARVCPHAPPATAAPCPLQARCFQYSTSATPKGRTIWTTKSQDNQSPGTLQSSLWTSRWLCAVVRVLTIAGGPGGRHRPQPARAGAPRPIPVRHVRSRMPTSEIAACTGVTKHKALQHTTHQTISTQVIAREDRLFLPCGLACSTR